MDDMPSMTIGTMLASVLQFIVIVGVLAPVLLLTTVGGGGVLTPGFAASFNGVVTNSSGFFVNPNGDLQSGLSTITAQNANGLAGGAGHQGFRPTPVRRHTVSAAMVPSGAASP